MKNKTWQALSDRLSELEIPENPATKHVIRLFLAGGYVMVVRDRPEKEMFLIPKTFVDKTPPEIG